jgi:hypothetical protein
MLPEIERCHVFIAYGVQPGPHPCFHIRTSAVKMWQQFGPVLSRLKNLGRDVETPEVGSAYLCYRFRVSAAIEIRAMLS